MVFRTRDPTCIPVLVNATMVRKPVSALKPLANGSPAPKAYTTPAGRLDQDSDELRSGPAALARRQRSNIHSPPTRSKAATISRHHQVHHPAHDDTIISVREELATIAALRVGRPGTG